MQNDNRLWVLDATLVSHLENDGQQGGVVPAGGGSDL